MRRARIDEQNRILLAQQRQSRMAADVVTDAFMGFPEVQAVAVIGSVARRLWKEVPRFPAFRRAGVEVWHECKDLDLAVWIASQDRLGELRRARDLALRNAFEGVAGLRVTSHQAEVFLIEPGTNRYLGRLCNYNACPKGKLDCAVPGCGAVAFNRRIEGFVPHTDLLAGAGASTLYERGTGRLRSALDLPTVEDDDASAVPRETTGDASPPIAG